MNRFPNKDPPHLILLFLMDLSSQATLTPHALLQAHRRLQPLLN
jgi:hypothetical protein